MFLSSTSTVEQIKFARIYISRIREMGSQTRTLDSWTIAVNLGFKKPKFTAIVHSVLKVSAFIGSDGCMSQKQFTIPPIDCYKLYINQDIGLWIVVTHNSPSDVPIDIEFISNKGDRELEWIVNSDICCPGHCTETNQKPAINTVKTNLPLLISFSFLPLYSISRRLDQNI